MSYSLTFKVSNVPLLLIGVSISPNLDVTVLFLVDFRTVLVMGGAIPPWAGVFPRFLGTLAFLAVVAFLARDLT